MKLDEISSIIDKSMRFPRRQNIPTLFSDISK